MVPSLSKTLVVILMNAVATWSSAAMLEMKLRGYCSESKALSSTAGEKSVLTCSPTEHMTKIGLITLNVQRVLKDSLS